MNAWDFGINRLTFDSNHVAILIFTYHTCRSKLPYAHGKNNLYQDSSYHAASQWEQNKEKSFQAQESIYHLSKPKEPDGSKDGQQHLNNDSRILRETKKENPDGRNALHSGARTIVSQKGADTKRPSLRTSKLPAPRIIRQTNKDNRISQMGSTNGVHTQQKMSKITNDFVSGPKMYVTPTKTAQIEPKSLQISPSVDKNLTPQTAQLRWLEKHPELVFGGGNKISNSPAETMVGLWLI